MTSLAASAFWDTRYAEVGGAPQSPHTAAIHSTVRDIIPDDVATILDAGCGGGALMTFLARENRYTIEGVDQSAEGIRCVVESLGMKAKVGDITNLSNLADNSFDLVICSEVFEHLPLPMMTQAVRELTRVAARYVIITNPFREDLRYHQVQCDHCVSRHHLVGHIHSMDDSFLTPIVSPCAKSVSFFYSGQSDYRSPLYASLLRAFGYRLIDTQSPCPQCGSEVPFKKWTLAVRASGHVYRTLQRTLKFFGVHRPANVVTFIEVN